MGQLSLSRRQYELFPSCQLLPRPISSMTERPREPWRVRRESRPDPATTLYRRRKRKEHTAYVYPHHSPCRRESTKSGPCFGSKPYSLSHRAQFRGCHTLTHKVSYSCPWKGSMSEVERNTETPSQVLPRKDGRVAGTSFP